MKRGIKIFYTSLFLLLTFLILTNSQASLYFALNGLNLWFSKMIPALLPFMILSSIMVRLRLTEGFVSLVHPFLAGIFKVRKNVTYAILMGFLCGFPMGARVTCDLLSRDIISKEEGSFLLAFCNNIGPVYFLSFVMPLLHRELLLPYLFGMYGLPLLYGLILRHTVYRRLIFGEKSSHASSLKELAATEKKSALSLLEQIDDSVYSGIQSILMLGGYMILFNLFNLFPYALTHAADTLARRGFLTEAFKNRLSALPALIAPILEITGGLGMLKDTRPLLTLVLLPFGGLSCIAQTYSMIRHTGLSLKAYVMHKLTLTGLTLLFYLGWAVCFPASFLH